MIGGLSLAGMMSLSVIERTREIGVMRAVAAIPFGSLLATGIGMALTGGEPIPFQFSLVGAVSWVLISTILAALSSLQPAHVASRVAVRDALAYEE